jgi:L-alanine-DL-glutamate epimerase-like enolase superfamily enzyme
MRLEHELLELEPEHPFRISRETQRRARRVWVRLEADGVEGWGEAAPSAYYGEDADSVVAALETVRPLLESTGDPEALERLDRGLRERIPEAGAARAGVTAALHDLQGKRLGRPLWRLWGLDREAAPASSFTLGIDAPEVMERKARAARDWPVLKVKLGIEAGREEAILEAVRSGAPETPIRVDANAGWTAETAPDRIRRLAEAGVEMVEQPLPPEDREGLERVCRASPLPVVLDESCVDPSDVPGLRGLAHGVNVKLAKCGGPRRALEAIHAARASGLRVMLGCMLESSLGIAPAAHLAPLADWVDLDGAALLASDPFTGPGPAGDGEGPRGALRLGDAPGLGVRSRG